jgi:hypothetical protein
MLLYFVLLCVTNQLCCMLLSEHINCIHETYQQFMIPQTLVGGQNVLVLISYPIS